MCRTKSVLWIPLLAACACTECPECPPCDGAAAAGVDAGLDAGEVDAGDEEETDAGVDAAPIGGAPRRSRATSSTAAPGSTG